MWRFAGLMLASLGLPAASRPCPGAVAAGSFHLRVQPPTGGDALPLRQVNALGSGYRITYQPTRLPPEVKKDAKVAVVLIPPGDAQATVLGLQSAAGTAEWIVPFRTGVVAFLLGPQGLDDRRITSLVTKDQELIAQLADYAQQTAELEGAIDSLDAMDQQELPEEASGPAEQAIFTLLRALNPVVAAYNPLGAGRRIAPVTLAGRAAGGFFENAGGIVPGGEALGAVKGWLFPDTQFRATFAQDAGSDGLTLCAQRLPRGRDRLAYLWAYRVLDSGPPSLAVARTTHLPIGARSALPMESGSDWNHAGRVRGWALNRIPVPVRPGVQGRSLSLDLSKFPGLPGIYRLSGRWDWSTVEVGGEIHVDRLGDLTAARLTEDSVVRLVEGTGPAVLRLEGTDFQFVDRVTLTRIAPVELSVSPPRRERSCPQPFLEVEVDTNQWRAGRYTLALAQAGGPPQEIPLRVTPPHPRIDNLPLRVNVGETTVVLRGSGLDRLESVESGQAEVRLGPAGSGSEREATIVLRAGAKKGDRLAFALRVQGLEVPIRLAEALQVLGPRPRITAVQPSLPQDLGVALREGELPAGVFVGLSVRAEQVDGPGTLRLRCGDQEAALDPRPLRAGEYFVSYSAPAACAVTAVLATEAGRSDAFPAGRAVRLPRIENFTLTGERLPGGLFAGVLKGRDLETIEKAGWTPATPQAVPGLPVPSGEGPRQTLQIALPWPSPAPRSPLYIWLRQESEPRATTARY
jgi:hypothetical protein